NRVPFPGLTSREREVLDLLAAGLPNSAIARRLSLASKTVSNHLSAIFAKLQVSSRSAAIVLARPAGLGRASAQVQTPRAAGGCGPGAAARGGRARCTARAAAARRWRSPR